MYKCFVCNCLNTSINAYFDHLRYFHKISSLSNFFKCTDCSQSFQNMYSFRKHLKNMHPVVNPEITFNHNNEFNPNPASNNILLINEDDEEDAEGGAEEGAREDEPISTSLSFDPFQHSFGLAMDLFGHKSISRKLAGELILNFQQYNQKFIEDIEKSTDLVTCKLKLVEFKNSLTYFDSESKFANHLRKNDLYTTPEEFIIDDSKTLDTFALTTSKGILVSFKDNIRRFLEVPNILSDMLTNLERLKEENNISNVVQGCVWLSKIENFKDKIVIPIQLFQDDLEVGNALGAKSGVNKVTSTYMTFPLLKDELVSKLENIITCCLNKAIDIEHGNVSNFMPLIITLKDMEENGLEINLGDNKKVKIYLILSNISGDNLGLNSLLGYTKSFAANHYCRICTAHKIDMAKDCSEDKKLLRNERNYREGMNEEDVGTRVTNSGIKEDCVFHHLPSFKVWNNVTCDITHDFFEGIAHYQLADILNYFLYEKFYFTLAQLNSRKSLFKYGYDNDSKSVDINIKHIQNQKFKMSASQMKCFLHYLPLFIGDYIKKGDKVWEFTLTFLRLGNCILAPSFDANSLCELTNLIHTHHSTYLKLFPNSHLKPKHHFITHYSTIIAKLGPLKKMWTIRYEAKHKEIKQYALICCSRKNLLLSLAIKANYVFAKVLYNKKNSLNPKSQTVQDGNSTDLSHIYDNLSHNNSLHIFQRKDFNNIFSTNKFNIFDTIYKIEDIITVKETELCFFSIKYIIKIHNIQYAICIKIDILEYDEHLNCYLVNQMLPENIVYSILVVSMINYPPLEIIKTSKGEHAIKLKPSF